MLSLGLQGQISEQTLCAILCAFQLRLLKPDGSRGRSWIDLPASQPLASAVALPYLLVIAMCRILSLAVCEQCRYAYK